MEGATLGGIPPATDTGTAVPDCGFADSPLAVGDLVVVAVSGTLGAHDRATGEPRWFGPSGLGSYSSPYPLAIDGEAQVLLLSSSGLTSVAPRDGKVLWEHAWPGGDRIVQLAATREWGLLVRRETASVCATLLSRAAPPNIKGANRLHAPEALP